MPSLSKKCTIFCYPYYSFFLFLLKSNHQNLHPRPTPKIRFYATLPWKKSFFTPSPHSTKIQILCPPPPTKNKILCPPTPPLVKIAYFQRSESGVPCKLSGPFLAAPTPPPKKKKTKWKNRHIPHWPQWFHNPFLME